MQLTGDGRMGEQVEEERAEHGSYPETPPWTPASSDSLVTSPGRSCDLR